MSKKGQHLTKHQQGIVKRYYDNREDIATQKLGDLVTELYLCTSPKKAEKLWERIETSLRHAGGNDRIIRKIVEAKDLEKLASYVSRLF